MSLIRKVETLSGKVVIPQLKKTRTISLQFGTIVTGIEVVSIKTTSTQARATILRTEFEGRNVHIIYRGAGQVAKSFRTVVTIDISFDPVIDPEQEANTESEQP